MLLSTIARGSVESTFVAYAIAVLASSLRAMTWSDCGVSQDSRLIDGVCALAAADASEMSKYFIVLQYRTSVPNYNLESKTVKVYRLRYTAQPAFCPSLSRVE